jgi:DNA-binding transcriptional regulator GbsR (MarR family)
MNQKSNNYHDIIEPELFGEIVIFENFLHRIGFKRIDGAIFGLLVLASRPLTSEEIEKVLELSQSAVSLSLKNLIHFGAVETRDSRAGRAKLHRPKENALSIVACVFRKREQEAINEFKEMAMRSHKKVSSHGPRARRLQSILATCELAEAVMSFVFTLAKIDRHEQIRPVIAQVPRALDLVVKTASPLADAAKGWLDNFSLLSSKTNTKDSNHDTAL